jgi:hypothetical protein
VDLNGFVTNLKFYKWIITHNHNVSSYYSTVLCEEDGIASITTHNIKRTMSDNRE